MNMMITAKMKMIKSRMIREIAVSKRIHDHNESNQLTHAYDGFLHPAHETSMSHVCMVVVVVGLEQK